MQSHGRLPRSRATDLDFTPTDSAHAEAEDFGDGLFRGPPTREMQDVRAAIHLLPLRIDAIEKPTGMFLENIAYAHRLDDVDTNL